MLTDKERTRRYRNKLKAIKELQVFLNSELDPNWSPKSDFDKLEKLLVKTQKMNKEFWDIFK